MKEPEDDPYAVLGAGQSESPQQLRQRYQQLALQFHPDRLVGRSPSEVHNALQRFLQVEAAWRVLGDHASRRRYDLQRRAQELKQDWPEDSVLRLEDLNWDPGARLYTHPCRCGGAFSVPQEEVEEDEQGGGVVVCCDSCSLSVYVTLVPPPDQVTDPPS